MGLPAYVIEADKLSSVPEMLRESGLRIERVEGLSPLGVQFKCITDSRTEVVVRFGTSDVALPGKLVVILQPGGGWPWKLRTQERIMDQLADILKSHGAISLRDAT